ncbi:MAG: hypothetical protein DCO96_06905 [Fluviicola sp. XM-24bin1]|nr:MAG: hypothetical protein DCO96_06905 [Fluviicola sp. XM-24bin1]
MSGTHLGINLSESHVEFTILSGEVQLFHHSESYQGKTDQDRKDAVRKLIDAHAQLSGDFENVTLAWSHAQSSLVPAAVFSESTPKDIFKLCFGSSVDPSNVDHNRIFELSVVNVYAIPNWVKSLLVIKYPQIIMQHAGTHQIRKALHSDAFYTKATVVLNKDYFRITLVKHNKLEFYSSFDYQTAEDVIYHLNFVLQQKELLGEKGMIEIGTNGSVDQKIVDEAIEGIQKIQHLQKMNTAFAKAYLTNSQLLCV